MIVRNIMAAICVFSLTGMAVIACEPDEAKKVEADFEPLSKRFLAALQSEQVDEALACWLPPDRVGDLAATVPEGVPKPPPEEIALAKKYFQQRDENVKRLFPKIIAALKENDLDAKQLSYASSTGDPQRFRDQVWQDRVGMVYLIFEAKNGKQVKLRVDDGGRLDGTWYFMDEPLDLWLIQDGQESLMSTLD